MLLPILILFFNVTLVTCFNLQGPLLGKQGNTVQSLTNYNKKQTYDDNDNDNDNNNDNDCYLSNLPKRYPFEVEMNKNAYNIPKGQCTEWADGRYYQLTGQHATFNGDAYMWGKIASTSGNWKVSSRPSVPSIMVTERYTNGAQQYGHVSIVESIIDEYTVCTSNWNFPNLGELSLKKVKVIKGTSFLSHK